MSTKRLTLGSLFSGSGGFELAGMLAGIEPVWNSEVAPFPVLVTHRRLPQVKHYGDVSKLKGSELEPVDIITFGSPCFPAGTLVLTTEGCVPIEEVRIGMKVLTHQGRWRAVTAAGWKEGETVVLHAANGTLECTPNHPIYSLGPNRETVWIPAAEMEGRLWAVPLTEKLPRLAATPVEKDDLHLWYRVESVTPTGQTKTVYNLTVEEDNSYVAGGIVVHNCQDVSIAGKRAGIHEGARSSLFFQAIRIIKEMREKTNGERPRFCVLENVAGLMSSNGGDDFKAVLEAIIGVKEAGVEVPAPENHRWPKADVYLGDGWSLAYRTFDAQWWGTPQRRKRIYLVADFAGGSAGEVLFKSEGLSGYSAEGFRAWQRTAGGAEEGAGAAGGRTDHRGGEDDGRVTLCINPQGNSGVGITEDKTLALVAQDHGNHPSVLQAAGFCTEHSAKARSIGYEEEKSPTLRAGVVPAALAVESNPTDSRVKISEDGVVQTLTQRMGTGGNNTPLVAQPEIRAFGVCSKSSHAMLSDNPRSGFYEAKVSRTLDQSGGNAVTSAQGGIAVVAPDPSYAIQGSMIGRTEKNGPQGDGVNEEVSFTLNTVDRHAVVAPSGEHYSASKNSHFTSAIRERANTLVATDYKEPPLVNDTPNEEPVYIVRRLTPVECARLQGFPDWWCDGLAIPEPTDEELAFWTGVWETWRKVTNPDGRPKTEKQIRKWLADPYTDSEEYRLWGNGVFLGNAYFVLAGVAWAAAKGG